MLPPRSLPPLQDIDDVASKRSKLPGTVGTIDLPGAVDLSAPPAATRVLDIVDDEDDSLAKACDSMLSAFRSHLVALGAALNTAESGVHSKSIGVIEHKLRKMSAGQPAAQGQPWPGGEMRPPGDAILKPVFANGFHRDAGKTNGLTTNGRTEKRGLSRSSTPKTATAPPKRRVVGGMMGPREAAREEKRRASMRASVRASDIRTERQGSGEIKELKASAGMLLQVPGGAGDEKHRGGSACSSRQPSEEGDRFRGRSIRMTQDDLYASAKAKEIAAYHEQVGEDKNVNCMRRCCRRLRRVNTSNWKEGISGIMIVMNSVMIGLSIDMWQDAPFWEWLEIFFVIFFTFELIHTANSQGLMKFFFGGDWQWNMLDFLLVSIGIFDISCSIILKEAASAANNAGRLSMLKMLRLGRLARLIRLLRLKVFKDLKAMAVGVFAGMRVLGWAIVLLFVTCYALALVAKQVIGDDTPYGEFKNVPWAMFTVFHCVTTGCSARDGSPLHMWLFEKHGAGFLFGYVFAFLFVTIGLFNLIVAVFVDNVMETNRMRNNTKREDDTLLQCNKLRDLVTELQSGKAAMMNEPQNLIEAFLMKAREKICGKQQEPRELEAFASTIPVQPVDITREVFLLWLDDPRVVSMLDELDVCTSNRSDLFDVIDADNSGVLDEDELVLGLMKLRGPAERGDAVACRLTLDFMQGSLEEHHKEVSDILRHITLHQRALHEGLENAGIPVPEVVGDLSDLSDVGCMRTPEMSDMSDSDRSSDMN
eukprot:TRINITY_DN34729_c0_g1_i1.p1 TRINITY_DN34729_c0_g1~~TRINITY_DN34729_c0_g1_i1.p1  ORF type:complete len:763 (-),score=163.21 TRINITY_DN34729_c0_g1_i1:142-2430(-)